MNGVIFTDEEKCVGCNKCIFACPVKDANIAFMDKGKNKIKVDPENAFFVVSVLMFVITGPEII